MNPLASSDPPVNRWHHEHLAALAAALALATYQLSPAPVAVASALGLVVLAVFFPAAALVAVPLSLPFVLVARPLADGFSVSGTEAAILACAAGAAARFMRRPQWPRLTRDDLLVLAFLGLGIASLAVSTYPRESLRLLRTVVLEPIVFYYLVVTQVTDRRGLVRLGYALVAAGVAISAIGLYQYAVNVNIITAEEDLRRVRGFYGSPNNLGLFLGRVVPLAACFVAFGRRKRALHAAALLVMLAVLVLTFSAGAWVATLTALVFVAALVGRRALLLAAVVGAALALAALPVLLTVERFRVHLDLSAGTSFARVQVWLAGLAMVRDHPLLGIGLDNFLYYYRSGYMLPAAWREPDLSHPHNLILDFWLSLGLPGLVVFLVLIVGYFTRGWRLVSDGGGPAGRAADDGHRREGGSGTMGAAAPGEGQTDPAPPPSAGTYLRWLGLALRRGRHSLQSSLPAAGSTTATSGERGLPPVQASGWVSLLPGSEWDEGVGSVSGAGPTEARSDPCGGRCDQIDSCSKTESARRPPGTGSVGRARSEGSVPEDAGHGLPAVLGMTVHSAWAQVRRPNVTPLARVSDPSLRALVAGAFAGMVDFVVHGLIDNSYFVADLAVTFWLGFAILRMADCLSRERAPAAPD